MGNTRGAAELDLITAVRAVPVPAGDDITLLLHPPPRNNVGRVVFQYEKNVRGAAD